MVREPPDVSLQLNGRLIGGVAGISAFAQSPQPRPDILLEPGGMNEGRSIILDPPESAIHLLDGGPGGGDRPAYGREGGSAFAEFSRA